MSQYGDKMTKKAYEYAKKYNLDVTKGTMGWNDEADAFRHAFMQASITTNSNEEIANVLGSGNEILGDVAHNQDPKEKNMDLWNNQIGRQVGEEVKKELEGQNYTKQELEDKIAEKIIERIDNGDLITNPNSDGRSFEQLQKENESQNPTLTGRVEYNKPFTREDIANMTPEEFSKNEDEIMRQMANGEIQSETSNSQEYQKYLNKEGKIFTREEIGNMSSEDYQKNEPAIMKQLDSVGIPSEKDLDNNQSDTQNNSQTKTEGNSSKGSGKSSSGGSKSGGNSSGGGSSFGDGNWVTINGHHVLMED